MVLPDFLLIIGVLLAGASIYAAAFSFFETIFAPNMPALTWTTGEAPKQSRSPIIRLAKPLVHRLILPLTTRYKLSRYKAQLKRQIQSAGLGQELNEEEYIGLQVFLGIAFPLAIMAINVLFEMGYPVILILVIAFAGFFYPQAYVRGARQQRQAQIRLDLPFVVDLLALSTEAGLDFIGAIQKVVDKMNPGPLAEELSQMLGDLKLGSSRADALNNMSYRIDMSEVNSFIAVLVTADAMGASIGGVLRQQSEQMRSARFTAAEKAGAEASQKIFIPLVLFILPAVLLLAFGPVILQFVGGGQ